MKLLLERRSRRRLMPAVVDHFLLRALAQRADIARRLRGQPLAVYANDWVGLNVNIHGVYEGGELDLLFEFLSPLKSIFAQGLALDIGGNVGNHSVYFSSRFARVHAFEPHPKTVQLLRFNASYRTNIDVHHYGLGDAPGRFQLVEEDANFGGAAIMAGTGEGQTSFEIEVQRLDDTSLDLTGLCFVKIDVEGFEARVIAGASRLLAQHQPVVVFEQHAAEFRGGAQETPTIGLLRNLGYRFCWNNVGVLRRPWLARRMINVVELFRGRRETAAIVTGPQVPAKSHSMLIAIPPRFAPALGLND